MKDVKGLRLERLPGCLPRRPIVWLLAVPVLLLGGMFPGGMFPGGMFPGGTAVAEDLPALERDQVVQAAGAPGSVSSVLFHKLPEGLPIEVATFDDSDTNLEIQARFAEELEKSGYLVAENAPLELSFTSEVVQGELRERTGSLGRIGASNEADRGTRGSDTGVDVEVNVWSSTQDSVLGGIQPQATGGRQAQFHINALLRDRDSGQVLWQGDAFSAMVMSDERRLAGAMVKPLVGAFGRSVKNEPFQVR